MGHLADKAAAASESSHYGETSPETERTNFTAKGEKHISHSLNVNELLDSLLGEYCGCSVQVWRILFLTAMLLSTLLSAYKC